MAGGTFPTTLDVPVPLGRVLGDEMEDNHAVPEEITKRFASAAHHLRRLSEAFPEGTVHRGLFFGLANCVESEHRDYSPARVAETTARSTSSRCLCGKTPEAPPGPATK